MTTKDERIGVRMPSETKDSLLQIARKEGRNLAQVCEILLQAEIHSYEKEHTKDLHGCIPADRHKDRGLRPDRAQGAHEHEAKEHDLPLVRQRRARGGALLRRHLS